MKKRVAGGEQVWRNTIKHVFEINASFAIPSSGRLISDLRHWWQALSHQWQALPPGRPSRTADTKKQTQKSPTAAAIEQYLPQR
tara:strand:+ start:256 stop:507 length:252 start_codon:yes stop_codon:yes gene_type:complete